MIDHMREVLGLSEVEQTDIILDVGLEYIDHFYRQRRHDPVLAEKMVQSPPFWDWWWNTWNNCDACIEHNVQRGNPPRYVGASIEDSAGWYAEKHRSLMMDEYRFTTPYSISNAIKATT